MDPNRRRTVAAAPGGAPPTVPSSIPRPTSRQSLAPSTSNPNLANSGNANFGRQSLAASRSAGAAGAGPHARQSLAAYAVGGGASVGALGGSQGDQFGGPSSNQQGSQQFSQGHGGPAGTRDAPQTGGRSNMYSSVGTASVGRSGVLRSSHAAEIPYAPPSERRSSHYRRSMAGIATTPTTLGGLTHALQRRGADPRKPDAATRARWATDIVAFLGTNQYTGVADVKMLLQPTITTPQFTSIFKFLITRLDHTYEFKGKSLAEEVPPALKMAMYPFADSITKSHLQAIGSSASWANMLAMLHWLVTLIDNKDQAFENNEELHIPAILDDDTPHADVLHHAWIEFVGDCYPQFLRLDDFNVEATKELDIFYQRVENSRRKLRQRVEDSELERERLEREWAEVNATPDPLVLANERLESIERDRKKFEKYLTGMEAKFEHSKNTTKLAQLEKEEAIRRRERSAQEVHETSATVKAQGLSPLEIQHMTEERTALSLAVMQNNKKQQAILEKTLGLEIQLQKRINSAQALTASYEAKAQELGILPQAPDGYEHVNFALEVNGSADNPVPDCLTSVKPALIELRAKQKAKCVETIEQDIVLEEKITRTREAIAELREQWMADQAELETIDAEIKELRESTSVEFSVVSAELDRLQASVNNLSSTMGHSLAGAEYRLSQRIMERDALIEEVAEARKMNNEAVETELDEIITYRSDMMAGAQLLVQLAEEGDVVMG